MERSLKRKVTKVIHFETQPTRKIQKVDDEYSDKNEVIRPKPITDENNIIENMRKLKISYKYEFYYDDDRPTRRSSEIGIVENNENNTENILVPEIDTKNDQTTSDSDSSNSDDKDENSESSLSSIDSDDETISINSDSDFSLSSFTSDLSDDDLIYLSDTSESDF